MLTKYSVLLLICIFACGCTDREKPARIDLSDTILRAEGIIILEKQDISQIAAPCDGKIVSVRTAAGQLVSPGMTLAFIENSDILTLQKEFLDAKNELEITSLQYARQGDLTVENATSLKRMENAKHDYQEAELKYKSLRRLLSLLGINPDSVNPDNMQARISIPSTVNGAITSARVNKGQFVKKGDFLFEIAGSQAMRIQIAIPETSVWKVKKNMPVRFKAVSDSSLTMDAQISELPEAIDPVNHTAVFIAKPSRLYDRLLPGMTVNAIIYLSDSKQ